MFIPGQKVVCVDDQFPLGIEKFYDALPKKDVTYVVRDIVPGISLQGTEGEVAVFLVGLNNPINKHGIERGFNAERFAPLQSDFDRLEETIGIVVPMRIRECTPEEAESLAKTYEILKERSNEHDLAQPE